MQTAEEIDIDFSGNEALRNTLAFVDDLFGADLPFSPGMTFVGARFSGSEKCGSGDDGAGIFSAGAADLDPERAVFRCLGEVAETLSQFSRFRPDGLALLPEEAAELDVARKFAAVFGEAVAARGWVACREALAGAPGLVPAILCFRDLRETIEPVPAFSTGFAAGQTLAAAVQTATLELIERDAVALWWFGGTPARALEAGQVPGLLEVVSAMRAGRTERQLVLLDLTSEIGIPVVAAVSANEEGKDIAFGFAARLEAGDAARAAVLELAQMEFANLLAAAKRQRGMQLSESEAEMLERCRDLILQDGLFEVAAGNGDRGETETVVVDLDTALAKHGIERFVVDLTSPRLGVPVAKVLCPGLQTISMDYRTERFRSALQRFGPRTGAASRHRPV
ncbi:YcaO-like family protein [Roseibium sp. M-1]